MRVHSTSVRWRVIQIGIYVIVIILTARWGSSRHVMYASTCVDVHRFDFRPDQQLAIINYMIQTVRNLLLIAIPNFVALWI